MEGPEGSPRAGRSGGGKEEVALALGKSQEARGQNLQGKGQWCVCGGAHLPLEADSHTKPAPSSLRGWDARLLELRKEHGGEGTPVPLSLQLAIGETLQCTRPSPRRDSSP